MNKSILNFIIISSVFVAGGTHAATGLLGQPGTHPTDQATDYDVLQDKSNQAIAHLANIADDLATQLNHQVGKNMQDVQQNKVTSTYAQKRADDAFANAAANRQALAEANKLAADNTAELANHEQRIEVLEQNTSANFGSLKNEVDQNRKRASAGIAGVAAMANIPQVIESQTFNVGAGVGTTDGESALSVGFSARASEHVVVKSAVSNDTQHNFVVGAGVAVGW